MTLSDKEIVRPNRAVGKPKFDPAKGSDGVWAFVGKGVFVTATVPAGVKAGDWEADTEVALRVRDCGGKVALRVRDRGAKTAVGR